MELIPVEDGEIMPGRPLSWPVFDEETNLLLREGEVVSQDEFDVWRACCLLYRPGTRQDDSSSRSTTDPP